MSHHTMQRAPCPTSMQIKKMKAMSVVSMSYAADSQDLAANAKAMTDSGIFPCMPNVILELALCLPDFFCCRARERAHPLPVQHVSLIACIFGTLRLQRCNLARQCFKL